MNEKDRTSQTTSGIKYVSDDGLMKRGWTPRLVARFLPDADQMSGDPKNQHRLHLISRIDAVEQTAEFLEARERAAGKTLSCFVCETPLKPPQRGFAMPVMMFIKKPHIVCEDVDCCSSWDCVGILERVAETTIRRFDALRSRFKAKGRLSEQDIAQCYHGARTSTARLVFLSRQVLDLIDPENVDPAPRAESESNGSSA